MSSLAPYSGTQRSLVMAIDVGTTYSGAAYAILDPREVPRIQGVSRYPGQSSGDYKIPSVLYYTDDGRVRAVGAEAYVPGFELIVEDEDLIFVDWFKLHLCPESMDPDSARESELHPLPPNKSVVDVLADFLAYLFACAKRYITETHASGTSLWNSLEGRIDFVLSHPNGWQGPQQAKMRHAAIKAGLVPDTPAGRARVHFVTEGEASLHYCVNSGLASDLIDEGERVMIIDAGGGTVDLSTYLFTGMAPVSAEEIAAPTSIMQGSTRVNARALRFLRAKLQHSRFGNHEHLADMMENFEASTKPTFKEGTEKSFIKFGSRADNDLAVGIRSGQMVLDGADIAGFFQPSLTAIVAAVQDQLRAAAHTVRAAFLVGGFAASPWLFSNLQDILSFMDIELSRPDNCTNKAVAEGAASFFLTSFVSTRIAQFTYGVVFNKTFLEYDPEHLQRRHLLQHRPSGRVSLPDGYRVYISKGARIKDDAEIRFNFFRESTRSRGLKRISAEITAYRGEGTAPRWVDIAPDLFVPLCEVRADMSGVKREEKQGPHGSYYTQDYDIVILCGQTELKAQICWIENGEEKRGDAQVIYDEYDEGESIVY
ncbi:heat shock protein 70 family protein [Phanerochaete sordida]|uniref:Heat shock protein 70 family protein n=1 Tax=Phanerochaete sordida TaxID=48140 RepID=A0A9P3GKN5_9APHY|nr:heat shock protein 70 family protein [Phanerochaete sordida]